MTDLRHFTLVHAINLKSATIAMTDEAYFFKWYDIGNYAKWYDIKVRIDFVNPVAEAEESESGVVELNYNFFIT